MRKSHVSTELTERKEEAMDSPGGRVFEEAEAKASAKTLGQEEVQYAAGTERSPVWLESRWPKSSGR